MSKKWFDKLTIPSTVSRSGQSNRPSEVEGKLFVILLVIVLVSCICGIATAATPAEIEQAIDSGISWLVTQQQGDGSWSDPSYGEPVACTGFAVIKLADRAFELSMEPNSNIDPQLGPFDPNYAYKGAVEAGLNFIFQNAFVVDVYNQPAGNPDTDGDGNGVRFGDEYRTVYSTGICMIAVAATRAPDRVVGPIDSQVDNWTYKQVLDDVVDFMAFAQTDTPNTGRGGWRYRGQDPDADNSNTGYAVLGLSYAESCAYGFNCAVPQFVKDELNIYIDFIQCDPGDSGHNSNTDGSSGYFSPCDWPNVLKNGNLIFEMEFVGRYLEDPDVQRALDYIGRTWNNPSQDPGWGNPADPHYQAMFCVMKGLEYAGIDTIVVDGNERDWYADFADAIVNAQQAGGYWPSDPWGGSVLATEWALLTLEKVTPISCRVELTKVDDINDCVGPGDEITYTISYSYLGDANCCPDINDVNIIDYLPDEVDFNSADSNGIYDPCSHTVTWNIGTLHPGDEGSVTLRVIVNYDGTGSTIINKCELKGIRDGNEVLETAYEHTSVCCSCCPTPDNGATDVRIDPVLSWMPGIYAATHDIYFGTDIDDVKNAKRSDQRGVLIKTDLTSVIPTTTYDIADDPDVGLLDFSTTYYWRIDDVNVDIWKGRIWSFTTGRYHVVEDFEDYNNTNELDDVWHAHSDVNAVSDMMCQQIHSGNQAMAIKYNNSSSCSEAYADSNGENSLEFGFNWMLKDVKALALWFHGIELRGSHSGSDPYTLEGDGVGINNTKYDTCYFFYKSIDKVTGVAEARVDSIENTDSSAMAGVMMRDTLNPNSIYAATVVTPDGRVIFMRRDSTINNSSAVATISGITIPHWVRITRFTPSTGPTKIFAQHANDVNDKPDKWSLIVPELPGVGMGSVPTFIGLCVTSNVFGEMCTAEISNVTMQAPVGTDAGQPNAAMDIGNYVYNDPEPMYVMLQDTDSNWTEYYEDKDDTVTQTGEWTQWRLDLNDFTGVEPCDVQRIHIGVGDKEPPYSSGSGTVFIDDIRLYLAEFYPPKCPPLQADLVRDGEVNYKDLKIVTDNWLIYNYDVTPVAPPNEPNLIAWYRLEQDPCDSAGPPYQNGEPNGIKTADYVAGMEGDYALDFKGDANFIETDYNAVNYGIDGNNPRTITAWVYSRSFDEYAAVYEIGGHEDGQEFSMLTKAEEPNVWRANHWGGPETWDIDFEYPSLNTWVHLAHTYDGIEVKVYADGYAIAIRALDLNTANTKTFSIGWWSYSEEPNYFDGIVDDVRIYNYALNPNEIAYIADTGAFTQPLELLLTPQDPNINLYSGEDPETIDFRDLAELGKHWGEMQVWPTW